MKEQKQLITTSAKKIKTGDRIKVISGSKKGFIGTILSTLTKKSQPLVIIEGLGSLQLRKGKNEEKSTEKYIPLCIHSSNVMLWDSENSKVSRITFIRRLLDGKKVRIFKTSGKIVNS